MPCHSRQVTPPTLTAYLCGCHTHIARHVITVRERPVYIYPHWRIPLPFIPKLSCGPMHALVAGGGEEQTQTSYRLARRHKAEVLATHAPYSHIATR